MNTLLDYAPLAKCRNPDTCGMVCVRCNDCGRFTREFQCVNCGQRIKEDFGWPKNWAAVEFYDKLRALICPACKKYFTKKELITNGYSHSVIGCKLVDFIKRSKGRKRKVKDD